MRVVRYQAKKHGDLMLSWLASRNAYIPSSEETPKHGVVAYEGSHFIAMGFLRRIEGGYAQVDGLVTNPATPGYLRNRACDAVTLKLIEIAKKLKIKGLAATTSDKNTLLRAMKHGFVHQPLAFVTKDIS